VPYADEGQQRKAQREWRQRRWEAWLQEHGPCVRCGSWDDLQVDHIDPSKKVSHRIWSWARDKREEELNKCQPLCGSCHKIKSGLERLPDHGTDSRYRHRTRKCRCNACRRAHAEANRRFRRNGRTLEVLKPVSAQKD
jgi:hypothetical protein